MSAWAAFIAVGPGAVLGPGGRKMTKRTSEDVSFLACAGLSRGA